MVWVDGCRRAMVRQDVLGAGVFLGCEPRIFWIGGQFYWKVHELLRTGPRFPLSKLHAALLGQTGAYHSCNHSTRNSGPAEFSFVVFGHNFSRWDRRSAPWGKGLQCWVLTGNQVLYSEALYMQKLGLGFTSHYLLCFLSLLLPFFRPFPYSPQWLCPPFLHGGQELSPSEQTFCFYTALCPGDAKPGWPCWNTL